MTYLNRVHLTGPVTFSSDFGPVCSVIIPRHVPGEGHREQVRVQFQGGLSMNLTPSSATDLVRRLQEGIVALSAAFPDVSGSVWAGE